MPKITVKSISIKRGENDKGAWVNTMITPTDGGRKWSGFNEGLVNLKEGDIIDITEYEEGQGNRANNIKKYQKVEAITPVSGGNGHYPEMNKEDWEQKQRIERESIEAQSARSAIFELAKNGIEDEDFKRVFDKALQYSELCIDRALSRKATPEPTKSKSSPKPATGKLDTSELDMSPINNAGDLFTRCKNINISRSDALKIIEVNDPADIIDLDEAWLAITKKVAEGAS